MLGLAVLKNALLAATVLLTFANVQRITGDPVRAGLAAAGLFLIPQFAWESQRALTHSVLVMTATALFVWLFLRLLARGRPLDYLLLGVGFALGVLSKFNFALIALALVLAALTLETFRARVLCRQALLALLAAGVLLAAPLWWIATHQAATMSRADKLTMGQAIGPLDALVEGGLSLLWSAVIFVLPLIGVYGVALIGVRRPSGAQPGERATLSLFSRALGIAFALCLLLVVGFEATRVKDRWLQPLLYLAPIILALWLGPWLIGWRRRFVFIAAGFCALAVIVILPLHTILGPTLSRPKLLNLPYADFATEIRALGFSEGTVLSDSNSVAGNLRPPVPRQRGPDPGLSGRRAGAARSGPAGLEGQR